MFSAATKTDNVSSAANYIEDVFSTYLYTGTASAITINNGIDLSTKGGLVWTKQRSSANDHVLIDTVRGSNQILYSNLTFGNDTNSTAITAFNSSGYVYGTYGAVNQSGQTYASWTFREQAKFFDVVTFTTNASKPPNTGSISHNLGSTPGCVMVKRTDSGQDWRVYHQGLGHSGFVATDRLLTLNGNFAAQTQSSWISVSSTTISFPGSALDNNGTYVAYLFAHNAGGFGATGTDNVITCGSVTGGGTTSVNLGYEPQWILMKNSVSAQDWWLVDNMRGLPAPSANASLLIPNKTDAEAALSVNINSTGFTTAAFSSGETYIYIAIRRGPMKTPTSGTSVFNLARAAEPISTPLLSPGTPPPDTVLHRPRLVETQTFSFADRLRGSNLILGSANTNAERSSPGSIVPPWVFSAGQNAQVAAGAYYNNSSFNYVAYSLVRAPGFFDVVCYTGTGSVLSLTHNLAVAPEFILIKSRSGSSYWIIGSNFGSTTYALKDDWGYNASSANQAYSSTIGFNSQPTSTSVSLSTNTALNVSSNTYVMYMWATCPGVSKVGTYTGTGALQTINCGFAAGARFVLITRIGVVGDVNTYIYDSARGITSGNDPYLLLETSAAEVTNTNYVDTAATGFQVTAAAPAGLNANGGTYIFLAIA